MPEASDATTDDLWEAMRTNRAVRRYRPDPVPAEVLTKCLTAATWAPSGGNQQPWRFVLLTSVETRAIVADGARASWAAMQRVYRLHVPDPADDSPKARVVRAMHEHMTSAASTPAIVLFCIQPQPGATPLQQGGSIFPAVHNFCLAARAQGLGAAICLWHMPVEDGLRRVIGLPEGWQVAATLTAGWPKGGHGPVKRRPLADVTFDDRWDVRWKQQP